MGTYVYRVTKETVKCSDGELANITIYAFKTHWNSREDSKMNFKSGCIASERMAAAGRITHRIVQGFKDEKTGKVVAYPNSAVFNNIHNLGSFYDATLGLKNQFPVVEGVSLL